MQGDLISEIQDDALGQWAQDGGVTSLLQTTEAHMSHLRIIEGFGPRFLPFSLLRSQRCLIRPWPCSKYVKKAVRRVG